MRHRRNNAVTLTEVVIASAIFATLATTVYFFIAGGAAKYQHDALKGGLHEEARRAVEEMARELRLADARTLTLSTYGGSDRVEFCLPRRLPDGTTEWDRRIQYRIESGLQPGASAPESWLVRDEPGATRILCWHVAPEGLTFVRVGDNLTLQLRLERSNGQGRQLEAAIQTAVTMRNRSPQP